MLQVPHIALVCAGLLFGAVSPVAIASPGAPSGGEKGGAVDLGVAAVLPPEITPPLATAVAERYRAAVEMGLTHAAVLTLGAAQTDQQRLATVGDCRTPSCVGRLAGALSAAWVFLPSLRFVGRNYKLRLELRDPKGHLVEEREEACDICTLSEVMEKAQAMALQAGGALRRRQEALRPPEEPPRRKARPSPVPPRRKVRPQERPVPRPPKVVPKPRPRPKPSLPQAAWMSGSMGLASLVAGVTLLALDGRTTCDETPGRLKCPYRYGTGTAGAAFTALGGASMVASGVLFYYAYFRHRGRREVPRATLGIAPTRRGAFAHAEIRF